jgi:hypothetical protein
MNRSSSQNQQLSFTTSSADSRLATAAAFAGAGGTFDGAARPERCDRRPPAARRLVPAAWPRTIPASDSEFRQRFRRRPDNSADNSATA